MRAVRVALLCGLCCWAGCGNPTLRPVRDEGATNPDPPTMVFRELSRSYIAWYAAHHPVRATSLGIHEHDDRLPDLSRPAIRRRAREARSWLARLEAIEPDALGEELALDHAVLDHAMRALLLELEQVRGWRNNPMLYTRAVANGVASLVDREFAPLAERLDRLVHRLDATATILDSARRNLRDVPRLWVDLALRSTRGTLRFVDQDAPAALEAQGLQRLDQAAVRDWRRARRRAVRELEAFAEWLQRNLAPRADGEFRLGAELFERKLRYEEHFDYSVDQLREMNADAIRDYRAWVEREVARYDPSLEPAEAMLRITQDHPASDELIATARRFVDQAHQFVLARELVTLPVDYLPSIRPTPAYARSGFASMSTPGPFESVATEAYYNITLVDPGWSAAQRAEHLTYFNYPGLLGISVHEVMPGHFVQLLYRQQVPSAVRRVFVPASLVEGWAHYVEQMMVDEGLGEQDPAVRLGQLRRALQRHARWEAGLGMHAFGDSVEAAAQRFQEIAYFAEFPAQRETWRGTYNPTYLYYALGRMEILRLRADYRAYLEARGERFSLREFHDRLLRLGLPIPLARRSLMPEG